MSVSRSPRPGVTVPCLSSRSATSEVATRDRGIQVDSHRSRRAAHRANDRDTGTPAVTWHWHWHAGGSMSSDGAASLFICKFICGWD